MWSSFESHATQPRPSVTPIIRLIFFHFFTKPHSYASKLGFKGPDLGHRFGLRGRSFAFSRHESLRRNAHGGHYFQNECSSKRVSPCCVPKWGVPLVLFEICDPASFNRTSVPTRLSYWSVCKVTYLLKRKKPSRYHAKGKWRLYSIHIQQ